MLPKIIALVGPIRAGKTTVSARLVEKHGYTLASNSEVLREIAVKLAIEPDRSNLKRIGDALFTTLGNDLIAQLRIKQHRFPIVVDGVRYAEEIIAYRQIGSFKLLGLTAPDELRFLRTQASHEGKDPGITREQFDELSEARSESQIAELLQKADRLIENDASIEDLTIAIDSLIHEWEQS